MRAIVTDGQESVWEESRDVPEPDDDEVLVKITAVGICGSDIGLIHGEGPPWTEYPLVPGHEVCAEVVETGAAVNDLKTGQRVSLHGFIYCGTCMACRDGRYYQCDKLKEVGFTVDGGYREYAALPAQTLRPLEDSISAIEATQIDSAACTLHALKRVETTYSDTAVVLGPGSLGLFGVQLLKAKGVEDIVLTGTRDERLEVGEQYGVNRMINVYDEDPVDAILEYTNGNGAGLCLETAGAGDVINTAVKVAAKQGSIVMTGGFDGPREVNPNDIVAKELNIVGGVTAAHAVDDIASLFQRGDLSTEDIVTHEFDFSEYETALETVMERRDGVIKAVLRP